MLLGSTGTWILIGVLIVWVSIITFLLVKTINHYNRVTRGTSGEDLKGILEKIIVNQDKIFTENFQLEKNLKDLEKNTEAHIQKVAAVRFNPYREAGGDQSFALALLNKEDTGFILLSLHSRDGTRTYVKPIKNGKSQYKLSKEEMEVLSLAKREKS